MPTSKCSIVNKCCSGKEAQYAIKWNNKPDLVMYFCEEGYNKIVTGKYVTVKSLNGRPLKRCDIQCS